MQLPHKIEVFFRGKIADKKAFVQVCRRVFLPVFRNGHVFSSGKDLPFVRPDQVENKTEQRCLTCAVVPYETDDLPGIHLQPGYVDDSSTMIRFCNIEDSQHIIYLSRYWFICSGIPAG